MLPRRTPNSQMAARQKTNKKLAVIVTTSSTQLEWTLRVPKVIQRALVGSPLAESWLKTLSMGTKLSFEMA